MSQAIWTRGGLGPPHQRDGRSLHRLDQPSFSEQVGPDRRHLRDPGALPAGVDPGASAEQGGLAARSLERVFPRLVRPGDHRSAALQRLAGVLEHGGAFARDTRRPRQDLRQVPRHAGVDAGSARRLRRRAALQAAPGGDRLVGAARRTVGRAQPEPHDVQAARSHRAVRGLGQRAVQRRFPAAARRKERLVAERARRATR